jgi:hypothetical protein
MVWDMLHFRALAFECICIASVFVLLKPSFTLWFCYVVLSPRNTFHVEVGRVAPVGTAVLDECHACLLTMRFK